jgi:predicted nuclease of predicted toxin-antitoxin system
LPQILVDENIPVSAIEWLKRKGFKVTRTSEISLKGAKDSIIAEYAAKNNMTILTLDTDFAQIYHSLLKGSITVIVIRVKPATPTNIIETLNAALKKIRIDEIQNKLAIITKKRIRIIT